MRITRHKTSFHISRITLTTAKHITYQSSIDRCILLTDSATTDFNICISCHFSQVCTTEDTAFHGATRHLHSCTSSDIGGIATAEDTTSVNIFCNLIAIFIKHLSMNHCTTRNVQRDITCHRSKVLKRLFGVKVVFTAHILHSRIRCRKRFPT